MVLVHAQESLLAEILRVLGVPDHAMDHMPAKSLVLAHQTLESTRRSVQDGIDEGLILGMVGREFIHLPSDTPLRQSVASARVATVPSIAVSPSPHRNSSPGPAHEQS